MFKIRKNQNSGPKLSLHHSKEKRPGLNRYSCLKQISNTQEHWKRFLENELQMNSTIVAFQNVQISMRVDAQKKLMLRQTFMLKKQIIKMIVNEQYETILQKLQLLRETSAADYGLATLFIDFYYIQKEIYALKLQYRHETISKIKNKMSKYYDKLQKQKGSVIYGRILYITALHLIKLDGVLIQNQDILIVSQALNSKKKELCMMTSDINHKTLESLLFLTFEFYKILYLLKRDQDLMTQYYNQIQAYLSIYKTKCDNYEQFEKNFRITSKIEKMKPLSLNLKVYDDHDRRRILSLQNTKLQLMKNHFALRNTNVLTSQINAQIFNREKKTLSRGNSIQSSYDKPSQDDSRSNGEQSTVLKQISNVHKESQVECHSWQNKFCFSFIKPDHSNILNGRFEVHFNENYSQFKVKIKIFRAQELVGMFQIGEFGLEKIKSLNNCAKKLWRVIKERFYTDKTEFLPNIFSFQYPPFADLPKHVNLTCELPILVRIHEMLLHYLRKESTTTKMNGSVILFPSSKVEPDKGEGDATQQQFKIFTKRYGFISFNKRLHRNRSLYENHMLGSHQPESDKQLKLTFFIQEQSQHYTAHIHIEKKDIKKFVISSLNQKGIKSERNIWLFKQDLLRLYRLSQHQERKRRVRKIIDHMQNHKELNQFFGSEDIFSTQRHVQKSIEEQFEVMKSPILETKFNAIKNYKKCDWNRFKIRQDSSLISKTIKIDHKYLIFQEQSYPCYRRYFDGKHQLIICSQNEKKEPLCKKFRLYKTIVFKNGVQANDYMKINCIKSKNEDSKREIKIKEQKIKVEWQKTYIGKTAKDKSYYFLNVFKWRQKIILSIYDFSTSKKYIGVLQGLKSNSFKFQFGENEMKVNGSLIEIKQLIDNRNQICEIQDFLEQNGVLSDNFH